MTESEIVKSYVRNGCKSTQIHILAELNAMSDNDIDMWKYKVVCILRANGVLVEDRITKGIEFKARSKDAFVLMSGFVGDCLSAMDSVPTKEQTMYLQEIDEAKEYLGGLVNG